MERLNGQRIASSILAAILLSSSIVVSADPATQPSSDVGALLQKVVAAYANLPSAEFDGHVVGHFDIAGQQKDLDVPFTSTWRAPNFFRHQAKDDMLVGSTGDKVYIYDATQKSYASSDAPKNRADLTDWPSNVTLILLQQNPSMLLAIAGGSSGPLQEIAGEMTHLPDTVLNGAACPTIQFELPDHEVVTMSFDPKTFLLRQAKYDLKKKLEARGSSPVVAALMTIDYTPSTAASPANDATFAWTPPDGATLASAGGNPSADDADQPNAAAVAMAGKPAPDFTASGLDDKPVKLSSLKGSVVVLDFWATWCAPCVMSMPSLIDLNKEQGPHGLKAFAVDWKEDKDPVKAFVQKQGWQIPVLLDPNGDVANQFSVVDGVPVTVIIGKDGIIKKVFSGTSDKVEEEIKSIVAKELGE